jgi:chromosome segregation ATPase
MVRGRLAISSFPKGERVPRGRTIIAPTRGITITETLDSALKERLRAVVQNEPVTEAGLRKLAEEGQACMLILGGQLQRSERRLEALASDPTSSLAEIADALREVNELRPDLDELEALLGELKERAREFRARWAASPSS